MRRTILGHGLSQWAALAPMTTVAIFALSCLTVLLRGPEALTSLDGGTVAWLLLAGCLNAAAYISLSRSLTILPVARANALSTLQSALSALGGVLIFAELLTGMVAAGLALSIGGAILSQQSRAAPAPTGAPVVPEGRTLSG
jgi:drug/metabolite transporter (DMT)-like permease